MFTTSREHVIVLKQLKTTSDNCIVIRFSTVIIVWIYATHVHLRTATQASMSMEPTVDPNSSERLSG
jgi:hypothetical protein